MSYRVTGLQSYKGLWMLLLVPLCGCVIPGQITSETVSGIGVRLSYNQTTQMPELTLGYFRQTYHSVPTNSPPITSSLSLEQHGFTTEIYEEFTTGNAQIPSNSVARVRAARLAPGRVTVPPVAPQPTKPPAEQSIPSSGIGVPLSSPKAQSVGLLDSAAPVFSFQFSETERRPIAVVELNADQSVNTYKQVGTIAYFDATNQPPTK